MPRAFLLLLSGLSLLATASLALEVPGATQAPIYHGNTRPAAQDNSHAGPGRVAPDAWEGVNLPSANYWQGGMSDFEPAIWRHGIWRHARHNNRLGWWWTVGPDWFAFEGPVYPYPDRFTPAGYQAGWWYWCDQTREYYPYVTDCPVPWASVMPRL